MLKTHSFNVMYIQIDGDRKKYRCESSLFVHLGRASFSCKNLRNSGDDYQINGFTFVGFDVPKNIETRERAI